MKLKPIAEQTIVITGASSGIGLATAQEAARQGARVVMNSRDPYDLREAVDRICAEGGKATLAVGDVADFEAVKQVAQCAVDKYGGIDTWVNNAGVSTYGLIEDVVLEDARRLFETNYWGVVHGSLVALPHLRQRGGGTLINIGSVLSETGYPLQGHYAASKHAVKGFTDSLRIELEKQDLPISVTLIQPAAIDTPYPEHARNYLAAEPQHAPPVYDPALVAEAIIECAQHPHRNLRIGGRAKMFTTVDKMMPALGDMIKQSHFEQQQADAPPHTGDTLHAPRLGDSSVRGRYPGHVMKHSVYTTVAKRPGSAAAAVIGVAAIGLGVLAARAIMDRAD